jgi:hypothetical protein
MVVWNIEARDASQGQVKDGPEQQRLDQGPNEAQRGVLIAELEVPEREQKEKFPGPAQISESDRLHPLSRGLRFPRLPGPPSKINGLEIKESRENTG